MPRVLVFGSCMNKKEFAEWVKNALQERFGETMEVKLQEVRKNNNVTLLGVMVCDKVMNISPTVYLDELFQDYENGRDKEELLNIVYECVKRGMPRKPIDMSFFVDYENVCNKLCFKLINQAKNAQLLTDIPNIPYLDLAICFYYPFWNEEIGAGSILIHNSHLQRWGKSVTDLWQAASKNTRTLCPEQCCPMEEVLLELTGSQAKVWPPLPEGGDDGYFPLRILTNQQRIFGASVIIYEGYLEALSQRMDSSFFLLPCSIHEMILIPQEDRVGVERLEDMVSSANETSVAEQDYLSDHVYYYDRQKKKVEIVSA